MTEEKQARTIAVIDGHSLMHRAFHAVPPTMNAPDGTPTNAVFGFLSMFLKLVDSFSPDGIICAFDKGKPKVRMEKLPQYKAQRPPMDPLLREQFPRVKKLMEALDVPVVELEGWEGDDILGTLAKRGEAAGYEMLLITGDRDMYQLATDHIKIVGTKRGLSDVAIMTPESVDDLYHGITPDLVPDFYGLKGDSSDNIPGVPGIGPKKASALIVQYGSLDEVIAHADEIRGKMGENLRAHIDDALLSREIATIRTDAPIEMDLEDAKFPTFDVEVARAELASLGINSMVKRVVDLAGGAAAMPASNVLAIPALLPADKNDETLSAVIAAGEWIAATLDDDRPANALFGLGHTLWAVTSKGLLKFDDDAADQAIVRLVREGKLASDDVKSLLRAVCQHDSSVPALIDLAEVDPTRIFDTSIADYLLESDRTSYEVADLTEQRLQLTIPEPTDDLPRRAIDAACVAALHKPLEAALEEDDSLELFNTIELPLVPVLVAMERAGLFCDRSKLSEQSQELGAEIAGIIENIHDQAGETFNVDSPKQLSHVLFDVLGLPTFGLKKTQRGYYSTNAKVLEDLSHQYPIVANVLEYRERAKIKSTYLDSLPLLIANDGRVHTTFNQTVAATGRLSSSDPNLQNIPTRSELGHRVRTAFTVPEGHVFLACDYSQIELRLLAHLSADEGLVAAFNEGADFHAATAARVFGVPVEEVTGQLRSRAKAVNFGIVYGQQAYGLATSLKIPRAEAQTMIDRYFAAYPGVKAFLDGQVAFAHKHGWVATMFGRKRHIAEINARNRQLQAFGERTAMNHPMQGSAADIIKIAMIRVAERLRQEGLRSKLVLQIHDELDFEVPEDEIEALSALVRETMEGVTELRVPLIADVSYGSTWADAK